MSVRISAVRRTTGSCELKFEVEDTGIGIPAAATPQLFEAFSQVDGSLTRKHGGTGLGLAICHKLTQLLGGQIGVESEVGKGTCFWLQIPVMPCGTSKAAPASTQVEAAHSVLEGSLHGIRILVADDSPVNCEIISELLTILGCEVDCVNDGRGAVRVVSEGNYAMVLMDCQMPVMDGYEATRQIRAREAGQRRTPIIAATAHAFESERQRAVAAGMDDYLPKPITLSSLSAMVYAWAQGGQSHPTPDDQHQAPSQAAPSSLDPDVYRSAGVVRAFMNDVPQQLERIKQAVRCADREEVSQAAHRLKGTCLMFGAPGMADVCLNLERGSGEPNALYAALVAEHARVCAELAGTSVAS